MKKTLITSLVAAAALAVPALASAHDGKHHHFGWFHHGTLSAALSGTGSLASASGTISSGSLGTGTFTSSVAATGASTTKTSDRGTLTCAPATQTLSLVGSSTVSASISGTECTWTKAGSTTASGSMFWGSSADTKSFLFVKSDGTVKGAVLKGVTFKPLLHSFSAKLHEASQHTGGCDH